MIWIISSVKRVSLDPLELRGMFRRTEMLLVGYSMYLVPHPLLCKFCGKSHRDVKVRPFPKSCRENHELVQVSGSSKRIALVVIQNIKKKKNILKINT